MSGGVGGFLRRLSAPAHKLFSTAHVDTLSTSTPADGDVVTYSAANGRWRSQALPAASSDFVRSDEVLLGAPASAMTFSAIPGTARHLLVVLDLQGTGAGSQIVRLRLNGISTSTYDYQYGIHYATTNEAGEAFAQSYVFMGYLPGTDAPAGSSWSGELLIPNYAGTTWLKQGQWRGAWYLGTASNNYQQGGGSGLLRASAATPITSIGLSPSFANFDTGARATLYLLK